MYAQGRVNLGPFFSEFRNIMSTIMLFRKWLIAFLLLLGGAWQSLAAELPNSLATVNGESVTRQELNAYLGRSADDTGSVQAFVLYPAVEQLIAQKLLKQEAARQQIAQRPETAWYLTQAKNALLGKTYLEQARKNVAVPSIDQVDKFILGNPKFFAQRQVFHLRQLTIETTESNAQKLLSSKIENKRNVEDILNELDKAGLKVEATTSWMGSEELEADQLQRATKAIDGAIIDQMQQGSKYTFVQRLGAYADPRDPEYVRSAVIGGLEIEAFNTRVADTMAVAKKSARIEYLVAPNVADSSWVAKVNGLMIPQLALDVGKGSSDDSTKALAEAKILGEAKSGLLQALINEFVLADVANREGVASQPDFKKELQKVEQAAPANVLLALEAQKISQPSADRVHQFIVQNPELFKHRQVFRFVAININKPFSEVQAEFKSLGPRPDIAEINTRLKTLGWKSARAYPWAGPEALTQEYFTTLKKLDRGEMAVLPVNQDSTTVLVKLNTYDDPILGLEAESRARLLIYNNDKRLGSQQYVGQLYAKAQVQLSDEVKAAEKIYNGTQVISQGWNARQWLTVVVYALQIALLIVWPLVVLLSYLKSKKSAHLAEQRRDVAQFSPSTDRWLNLSFLLFLIVASTVLFFNRINLSKFSALSILVVTIVTIALTLVSLSYLYVRNRAHASGFAERFSALSRLPVFGWVFVQAAILLAAYVH